MADLLVGGGTHWTDDQELRAQVAGGRGLMEWSIRDRPSSCSKPPSLPPFRWQVLTADLESLRRQRGQMPAAGYREAVRDLEAEIGGRQGTAGGSGGWWAWLVGSR